MIPPAHIRRDSPMLKRFRREGIDELLRHGRCLFQVKGGQLMQNAESMRSIKERYTCGDWENFKQFLIENDAVDCLERRIHQGNFKQFMSEHEQDGLPPGVNVMREYAITVRRASNK